MLENQTNSITKDYNFYLSCSEEELGKLCSNNVIKGRRLNKKIQNIKKIEKIKIFTKAITAKNKDINKNFIPLIPFKETSSYKSAMKYKANLSLDEQQKIINEVNDEINMKYDDEWSFFNKWSWQIIRETKKI